MRCLGNGSSFKRFLLAAPRFLRIVILQRCCNGHTRPSAFIMDLLGQLLDRENVGDLWVVVYG